MTTSQELLKKTNEQREAGDFSSSLQTSEQSLIEAVEENNLALFAETLAAKSLTYRHLYQKTNNKSFLLVARAEMEAAIEITKTLEDKTALAIPLFNLAKVYEALEESDKAISYFKNAVEALEQYPPESHNRPAVLADFKIHLYSAEAKNGDTSAIDRLKQSTKDLETAEEDSFNKNVWLSGAYMNLAFILMTHDTEQSKEYMSKAKEIIESDPRLTLRQKQWEKLAEIVN